MGLCGDHGIPCCPPGSFYSIVFEHCVTCTEECPFQKRHTLECIEHCSGTAIEVTADAAASEMTTQTQERDETFLSATVIVLVIAILGIVIMASIVSVCSLTYVFGKGRGLSKDIRSSMKEVQTLANGTVSEHYEMETFLPHSDYSDKISENKHRRALDDAYASPSITERAPNKLEPMYTIEDTTKHQHTNDDLSCLVDMNISNRNYDRKAERCNSCVSTQTSEDDIRGPTVRTQLNSLRHTSSATQTCTSDIQQSLISMSADTYDTHAATHSSELQSTARPYVITVPESYTSTVPNENEASSSIVQYIQPGDNQHSLTIGGDASVSLKMALNTAKYSDYNEANEGNIWSQRHPACIPQGGNPEQRNSSIIDSEERSDSNNVKTRQRSNSNCMDTVQRNENNDIQAPDNNQCLTYQQLPEITKNQEVPQFLSKLTSIDEETLPKLHQPNIESLPCILTQNKGSVYISHDVQVPQEIEDVITPRKPLSQEIEVNTNIDETALKGRPQTSLRNDNSETDHYKYVTTQPLTIDNHIPQPLIKTPANDYTAEETTVTANQNTAESNHVATANENAAQTNIKAPAPYLTASGNILSQPSHDSGYGQSISEQVPAAGGRDDGPPSQQWEIPESRGALGNISNHFQNEENIKEFTEREEWELKEWMRQFEEQPNYPIYEAIKQLPFLKGFQSEGDSIEVFIDCKKIDRIQALAELVHISGVDATKFQVTCQSEN